MAKKNRAPRPTLASMYLSKDEEMPGCNGRLAPRDGWYDVDYEKDFSWKNYREWQRRQQAQWEKNQTALGGVVTVNMNP